MDKKLGMETSYISPKTKTCKNDWWLCSLDFKMANSGELGRTLPFYSKITWTIANFQKKYCTGTLEVYVYS